VHVSHDLLPFSRNGSTPGFVRLYDSDIPVKAVKVSTVPAADPRVTLTIWDKEDPYRFVEVRGEVVKKVKGP
jgi:hypothetical protein